MMTQADRRKLEVFGVWIWTRIKKISRVDKITNNEMRRKC